VGLLSLAIDAYSLVVFLSVILSWLRLPDDHPLVRWTGKLTDPVLSPIRRWLPSGGGLDISPMVLLLGLRLLKRLLLN
jgi:YggT family protein